MNQLLDTDLPLTPSLERIHVRTDAVDTPVGRIETLVPASDPYICRDENAPAMLLVPGLGLDGLGLLRQLPLGALSHLHFFQMPNTCCEEESGLAKFARYVEEYVIAKKLDQRPGGLVLGGNSMGGAITLHIALRGRIKPRALVLIGTFASSRYLPYLQRLCAPLAYVLPMAFFRRFAWHFAGLTGVRNVSYAEGCWMASPGICRTFQYYGSAVAGLTQLELTDRLGEITLPTLIIHGTHDNVLPYAAGVELSEKIPEAKLVTIERARHSLFFTHHQQVNEAIAEFLRSIQLSNAVRALEL